MDLHTAILLAILAEERGEPVPVDVAFVLNAHGIPLHDDN